MYTKKVGNHPIILIPYVDDLVVNSGYPKHINHVKSSLKNYFEMIDSGHLHFFIRL